MFSWYKYLIVSLVFSHLGFWIGSLFLIAPFPDLCLLVLFCKLENAVHDLTDLIHEAARMSLKLKDRHLSKKRSFKHKKWFDYTLNELRASLIVCSRQLAYKPFDREMRQKCFRLHSKYLKTKRAKRRNFYSNSMLESISSNNPKAFWNLINKLKDENLENSDGIIESSTWKD